MLNKTVLITLVFGLMVFAVIGASMGFDESFPLILNAFYQNKGLMLVVLGCQLASIVFLWLRWHLIVLSSGVKVHPMDTFKITFIGGAINNLTPSARLGGEAAKIVMLNKAVGERTGVSASTIISEKLFDGIVFCFVGAVALFFAFGKIPLWLFGISLISLLFAFSLLVFAVQLSYNKRVGFTVLNGVLRKFGWLINKFRPLPIIRKHAFEGLDVFNEKTLEILRKKRVWFFGLLFSSLTWIFDVLRGFFIFRALGVEVGLPFIAIVLLLAMLIGSLPLLPGGLGSMESVMIIIYTSLGISFAAAGMQTIIDRAISFWLITTVGLLAAYHAGIKINGVKK